MKGLLEKAIRWHKGKLSTRKYVAVGSAVALAWVTVAATTSNPWLAFFAAMVTGLVLGMFDGYFERRIDQAWAGIEEYRDKGEFDSREST